LSFNINFYKTRSGKVMMLDIGSLYTIPSTGVLNVYIILQLM